MVKWDSDLRHNSDNSMETLVRMGEHIGQRLTDEERQEYQMAPKKSPKNSTIAKLLRQFPANDILK